ncbi:MAG TPA: PIN domain protein [bacterium]|nr:PIN domain protein [bacterium]HPO07789.1 PIN domain protein [bacterium]HQO34514.1 PIN domain protein [bacterium]HQP99225.1 PIN domain protein [bacterium]
MIRKTRIYADTSVFGGVADEEFKTIAFRFFEEVHAGRYALIISEITARELRDAPVVVRQFVSTLPEDAVEDLPFTPEMLELRNAYLSAKVVGQRWSDDAAHVAAATVARADLIVSWNFRHIVNWDKIRSFNSVNLRLGYPLMTILSPREVIANEEDL